jgi:hypothetical protein
MAVVAVKGSVVATFRDGIGPHCQRQPFFPIASSRLDKASRSKAATLKVNSKSIRYCNKWRARTNAL